MPRGEITTCTAPLDGLAISPDALATVAAEFARTMTSIRGRRVQRLVKREFAGADEVFITPAAGANRMAVLGVSPSGAAWCDTDGTGRHASVVKWRHGSNEALETQFDLLKDSLPVLQSRWSKLDERPWHASALDALQRRANSGCS